MDVLFGAITPENRRRDRLVVHNNLMGRVYTEENGSQLNTQLTDNKDRASIHSMPHVLSTMNFSLKALEDKSSKTDSSMTLVSMFPSTMDENGRERNRVWTIPEENITMKW